MSDSEAVAKKAIEAMVELSAVSDHIVLDLSAGFLFVAWGEGDVIDDLNEAVSEATR